MRFLPTVGVLASLLFIQLSFRVDKTGVSTTSYQSPANSPAHALWNANWVATDALGRSLPNRSEVGPVRVDKYVGIFYFLWHGEYQSKIHDISKILPMTGLRLRVGELPTIAPGEEIALCRVTNLLLLSQDERLTLPTKP